MSPTQRSLRYLRDLGYTCEVVEHFNSHTKRRKDLFGFGDILAVGNNTTILVQTTTGANMAERERKIITECATTARAWLRAGNEIELHGWRGLAAYRKDGKRKKHDRWEVRLSAVTMEDLD